VQRRTAMRNTIYSGILGCLLGATLGGACYVERDKVDHCANQDGDAYCMREYGAEAKFCSLGVCDEGKGDGCGSARPSSNACYSPCGEDRALEDDPSCEGLAEGSSSSDTVSSVESTVDPSGDPTTEPTGSMTMSGTETETVTVTATDSGPTTGGACVTSDECADPMSPICEDMVCVPCTDAAVPDDACAEKGAGTPVCRDDGACVACTPANAGACEGTTPVCDGATNECEGCNFHEQCPGAACNIATGACFAEDCVVEVDGDAGAGAEYDNIQAALVDGCVVVVHELNGVDVPYLGALEVDGITVAIVAADGEDPIVQGTGGPSLSVINDASVYVEGLTFRGNTMAEGVSVNGATMYLDRTRVVGNTGGGILLTNAATGHLRNCIVGGTGGSAPAISVVAGEATILDSTVVDPGINARALTCGVAGSAEIRNSLLYGEDDIDEVSCPGVAATYTASEQALAGEGNQSLALQNASFANFDSSDFLLSASGSALVDGVARWLTGDPLVDIEGDPRAAVDGAMEHAGADVP
jgi:hypothetical protein